MRFLGKPTLKTDALSLWYGVILYLSLAVIWSFLSLGLYGRQLNYLELRVMLLCKNGLIALVFLGRYLLFRNVRSPRFFKWATGLFMLIFLGSRISGAVYGMPGGSPLDWPVLILIFLEGLIVSIFFAGCAESIYAVFRWWRRLPRFEPHLSYRYWRYLGSDAFKLGLLVTLLMILAYIYIINFWLVDTILYSYLLMVPVIGAGLGLSGLLIKKVHGWRTDEIQAIDEELAAFIDWGKKRPDPEAGCRAPVSLEWIQYLEIIREYLTRMKQPRIRWWLVTAYLVFCGTILSLPFLFNVAIEV